MSSSFSFNSSIDTFNKTQITIVTVTLSDTYWSLLAFHYIVADYVRLEIQNGCFFTPQLQSGTGTRTQTFDNVLLSNFTGGPDIRVVTVIRGLSLSNPNGASHQVSVSSTLPLSKSYLVNTITAYEQNLLKWVCLTVLVVKENVLPKQYTYYNSQSLTDTTNMTTVFNFYPSVKASQYAFFGLSTLNIGFLGDTTWQLLLNTGDTTQVSLNATLSSNINEVVVEAVIFVFLDCFANYFKPETYSCVTSCATNFYYNTLRICTVCNPICLTCNSTATTCLTCNTTYHRSLTSNNCTCATGYYDTGVLNCSSCTKIFNCLVCSSATHCTGCSGVFIPNTAGKACVCPTGKFLVGNICS